MALEIIDIHQFDGHELAPLLEAESRVWHEELRWDFAPSMRMIFSCLLEKRLSGHVLVADSQAAGYCLFFCDGDKGLIGGLFVEPRGGRVDSARRLLDRSLESLIATPGVWRVEAQLPHFSLEGLEPCFRPRCFEAYHRRFMSVSLTHRPQHDRSSSAGRARNAQGGLAPSEDFLVLPWERKHDRDAAQLVYSAYRNHVDASINDQYGSLTGTTRLIENIVQHRGCGTFQPQISLVAIHRSTQKLAGILALTAVRPQTAHIPQVAIAKEFQGSGLGTALLERSFAELARQGYEEVSLTVTDLNVGAVRLYERLGFETYRAFGAFVWNRQ